MSAGQHLSSGQPATHRERGYHATRKQKTTGQPVTHYGYHTAKQHLTPGPPMPHIEGAYHVSGQHLTPRRPMTHYEGGYHLAGQPISGGEHRYLTLRHTAAANHEGA